MAFAKGVKRMSEYGKSREVSAPPERVWGIWTDTNTWKDWNPNVSSMDMPSPIAAGKKGVMNTPAGQHHIMEVIDVQPGMSFVLETAVIPGSR
ncbi:MAG: SRPBCC family protein, partial [Candidatus Dormibacteraeota bacterium]|nr:SRPBCC family protein [Candidatus Dormibacteraeota bacterium]